MAAAAENRVRFKKPPVTEVVCSVAFDWEGPGLRTVDFGHYGQRVAKDFPRIQEAAPLDRTVEHMTGPTPPAVSYQMLGMPPLRRVWYLTEDGKQLIQLQEDRFLFNWKRDNFEHDYPSYDKVIAWFEERWLDFQRFGEVRQLGKIVRRQFELTYVNLIGAVNGLSQVGHSSLLRDHLFDASAHRFLPEPEGYAWNSAYRLPDDWGRLHIQARRVNRTTDNTDLLRIDVIARGLPIVDGDVDDAMQRQWFDLAHKWITFGFKDATAKAAHEIWEVES